MDEVEFISSEVVRYIEKKLGRAVKQVVVSVSFSENGVEVDVDIDASVLVDETYLQRVADEAAELGVCIADLIREKGWPIEHREVAKCWRD
ncbi:conserved hypothetical protein [Pyrobaculum islandicum DSM 4184]|uniref:Uncharacterized protein n=1 Tax=Pyrobaculum islandicum (strain DSM 4184 / JCM 9189 / GEO3) TaxID=384616 RepID=A1RSS4_PYRIL|nr:hypothetical protein [Pyrobaculum islandicum]ABL88006.1 conserved hypothetical protein [Pyrobaculum islandicum DSM 4184]